MRNPWFLTATSLLLVPMLSPRSAPAQAVQNPAQTPSQALAPEPGDEGLPPLEETPLPPVPEIELPPLPPVAPVTPLTYAEYREGAFRAAQWAFRTEAAAALDHVAARFAGGGDALGRLETELQVLARDLRAAERALSDTFQSDGPEAENRRRTLRERTEQLQQQITAKSAEIEQRFPAYSELIRPKAHDFATVQALLADDEAILLIVNADDASYLFAITRDAFQWYRTADLPRAQIDAAVTRLRAALAPPGPTRSVVGGDRGASDLRTLFDRQLAHRLYRGLVEPANEIIGNKRVLMTITSGSLATLPLNVLVTEAPQGADSDGASMAATRWLADRHILAVLPAVSSLVALRCLLVMPADRAPGCPNELRPDASRQAGRPATLVLAAAGAPILSGDPAALRSSPAEIGSVFPDNQLADTEALRRLARLPGSLAELRALQRQYGDRARVLVEGEATETAVKSSEAIRHARYVVFATHGLLAGQAGIYGEPGLVFTPPAANRRSALDDGFLSASEVAQMRFDAQFVVLSACNTASAGGQSGGEGLSGLARSFFFAGARSVLVSHWEVSDQATYRLMTAAFGALDRPDVRGRGEAVQRAMQEVRRDPRFVAPRYWGAFTLVGDPS